MVDLVENLSFHSIIQITLSWSPGVKGIGIHLISSIDTSYKSFLNLLFVNILRPFKSMGSIKSVVCLLTHRLLNLLMPPKLFIVAAVLLLLILLLVLLLGGKSPWFYPENGPESYSSTPLKVYPFDSVVKLVSSFLSLRSYDNLRPKIYHA